MIFCRLAPFRLCKSLKKLPASTPDLSNKGRRASPIAVSSYGKNQGANCSDGNGYSGGNRRRTNGSMTRNLCSTATAAAVAAMACTTVLCVGAALAFSSLREPLGGIGGADPREFSGGRTAVGAEGKTAHVKRDRSSVAISKSRAAASAAKRARKLSEKSERELTRRPELKTRGGQLAFARYSLLAEYPHDHEAFTQGLSFEGGFLYESTGLFNGKSSLRKVEPETGKVLQIVNLEPKYFGEGMTILNNEIHSLTWRSNVGFTWDLETLERKKEFTFTTKTEQGWGITTDGTSLIVSDGSSFLFFWDPETMEETRRIEVRRADGLPLTRINELEMVKGHIFANVWFDNNLYKIDPASGKVVDEYNFGELYPAALKRQELRSKEACLNGIAWDPVEDVLYLTGKLWPRMYKVKLAEEPAPEGDGGDGPVEDASGSVSGDGGDQRARKQLRRS